ncbi:hypothetical protein RvY_06789 [Ramazzottius varieornatus]|uniref:Uncharacterized protein n=1 Tax=Ramazzottius varieornatus TaxID=947166 RepID=A0A1D1UZQ8_RAMVA|nr:hypothetical protein RvY_06789 [Ramazzottius varieornatus]
MSPFYFLVLVNVFSLFADGQPKHNISQRYRVEILTPGNYGPERGSLTYVEPAMDYGVSELQTLYPFLDLSHTYLFDEHFNSCLSITYNVDYLLSSKYHDLSRDPSCLIAIILPGTA